jgi:YndJ-like protein
MRRVAGWAATLAGAGVIAGVPLVAAGITVGQLGFGPHLECLSAWILAAAGLLTAWLHLDLARRSDRPPLTRILWAVSAVSLAAGMVLAALYGSRYYAPTRWLDIPWMRLLHGTANALGFALLGLSGWTLAEKRRHAPDATPFRGFTPPRA